MLRSVQGSMHSPVPTSVHDGIIQSLCKIACMVQQLANIPHDWLLTRCTRYVQCFVYHVLLNLLSTANSSNDALYSHNSAKNNAAQTVTCTADATKVDHTDYYRYYTALYEG
jgi:hypothetical protein